MADAGRFAKDTDILLRVGTNASATVKAAGWFDTIIVDCEAIISCACRFDWVAADTATAIDPKVRDILVDCGACLAAIEGISWDMSGFTSRTEAEDMINVLRDRYLFCISILRDKKVQQFMINA